MWSYYWGRVVDLEKNAKEIGVMLCFFKYREINIFFHDIQYDLSINLLGSNFIFLQFDILPKNPILTSFCFFVNFFFFLLSFINNNLLYWTIELFILNVKMFTFSIVMGWFSWLEKSWRIAHGHNFLATFHWARPRSFLFILIYIYIFL